MAKRSSSKRPLEWALGCINTTDATVTNCRIELGLRDDEVAEVHKISTIIQGGLARGANDLTEYNMMLSMDPDISSDPSVAANHDDLEVFYEHVLELVVDLTVSGQSQGPVAIDCSENFDPPILVGTDVGMVVKGDAAEVGAFKARLYFTRRRANVMELNQILLKRK